MVSCLTDTETPSGEVNYMMTRLYPGYELPQFQELASEKWKQMDPGTVPKTIKMMLVRPPMINLKMTIRADSAVSDADHSLDLGCLPLFAWGACL